MTKVNDDYVCIKIEDLTLNLRIGILEQERSAAQRILIDIDLYAAPDYLHNADARSIINYGTVCEQILSLQQRDHIDLLETLAQDIVKIALSYDAVKSTRIHIRKPDIIAQTQSVGIEVFKSRS